MDAEARIREHGNARVCGRREITRSMQEALLLGLLCLVGFEAARSTTFLPQSVRLEGRRRHSVRDQLVE
jgi:hypothetical protein